ncbi:MAG: DNA cytosine methyltransferase, partial [Promicromonosporaceae bacterium]|nr:DNA cytosine methyltransferase [Promicromonosporaceae bacterium]
FDVDESKTASPLTYISLFSSAGVGCYGFLLEGFQCIATNEIIARRIEVQRLNQKCKYNSGYIAGDISTPEVKQKIFREIERWKSDEYISDVDVVIATPPCQGMSVANHKKTSTEINRNSLIVESIKLILSIYPKVFVFENVPRLLKTSCTDIDGIERPIGESISRNLGGKYSIYSRVINFKDYGASSSRPRTLMIGVRLDLADAISPLELFPDARPEISLRECIGDLKSLPRFGQFDPDDILHNFRPYPKHMREWISGIAEGQSAFANTDISRTPHRIVDGVVVPNRQKNGDKYRRQFWDKVGPCVHTRNDQLASQNTIHPKDDRVFSIRELMRMMTVPSNFKWMHGDLTKLNRLSATEKRVLLRKHEMNIRQSLGEAVPTAVFQSIASNLKGLINQTHLSESELRVEAAKLRVSSSSTLLEYIVVNPRNLGTANLCRIAELLNTDREQKEAYFTNKSLITEVIQHLPDIPGDEVTILEPSVGAGNFVPLLVKAFAHKKRIRLTLVDIDAAALKFVKQLVEKQGFADNVQIEYVHGDFLLENFNSDFDLIIGNPPFAKITNRVQLATYRQDSVNPKATNTAAFFLEKSLFLGKHVALVMPKSLLNTPEYLETRSLLETHRINSILDFGERGFSGVLVETIAISVTRFAKIGATLVKSLTDNESFIFDQHYICDSRYPYWLIYRNQEFDVMSKKMQFGVFEVFRDRQVTNSILSQDPTDIRVIRSRNISDDGSITFIPGYDTFISAEDAQRLSVNRYLDNEDVYLAPNMTYKPRLARKPRGTLVNGSAAILSLKEGQPHLTQEEITFFASDEYRNFYRTARNRQTRSLNIDASSVFFFGRVMDDKAA